MSITILNYHDNALIQQVNTIALARAEAAKAAETASVSQDFSSALNDASNTYTSSQTTTSLSECPTDLYAIFKEAAEVYGVSINLLTSIARAESNFRTDAVSSAGAVGVMQLMPATAASLGVTNSYDARENIMGGAKYIAQLLNKYNGNTSLALAAYNAGSGNVEKYGGIPPFTETQNYVQKVLSYLNTENRTDVKEALSDLLSAKNISQDSLTAFVDLLQSVKSNNTLIATEVAEATDEVATANEQETETTASITVTVINNPVDTADAAFAETFKEPDTAFAQDTVTSEDAVAPLIEPAVLPAAENTI